MPSPRNESRTGGGIVAIPVYMLFSFFIAYSCISTIAGKAGILAYQDLLRQKAAIQETIDYLQDQNAKKMALVDELGKDSRAILERAAMLGYVREGELLIVLPESFQLSGGGASANERTLPVLAGESSGLPDSMIRIMAGLTGALTGLAALLFRFNPEKRTPRMSEAGAGEQS